MGAKRYSAGTIFLQVSPVFANFQKMVKDRAKEMDSALGDQMEKSGEKAGERAGKAASKSMGEELKKGSERELTAFEKSFKKTASKAAAHLSGAVGSEAKRLRSELKYLENLRIGVDISSGKAKAELNEILGEVKTLSRESVDIDAKVASGAALAELQRFSAAVEKVDNKDIDIKADVDTARARSKLAALAGSSDGASNSFRSFNLVMLAAAGAGPALVPVLGAIAGGLLAIGPAAAVAAFGLGSVLVGFSGISDGVKALQQREEDAAKAVADTGRVEAALGKKRQAITKSRVDGARRVADANRRVEDANRGVADAVRGVADAQRRAADAARAVEDARRSAGRAIKDALEQQRDAQRSYRDSIMEVKEAEQALREARRDARGTGEELDRKIEGNALDIDQAMLDSFDATVNYNAVQSDGSATNAEKEQARIDREEALLRLRELRAEAKDLAAEKKKWDKEGVNGTESVQSAQDQLNDAIESQKDAYRSLGEAARAVDQARADGARQVQDALRAQADAQRGVKDAQRGVADAQREVAEAERDARQAAIDARRGTADAMRDYADATDAAVAQSTRVADEFDKLGPAGKRFARFIRSLRDDFYRFRNDIQAVMLPSIEQAISGFLGSKNGGVLRSALIGLADGFGKFAIALSNSFQGEAWGKFFQMLASLGPQIQEAYGKAFISLLEAMASILTTLAPYALQFADAFARLMARFAEWAASPEGQESFQRFMGYIQKIAPKVIKFIDEFVDAMVNLAIAIAPYAELTLDYLTRFFELIADMDPNVLGPIVAAILAIVTSSQLAFGLLSALVGSVTLLGSTVASVVFAIVAIGIALAYLYRENKTFRDFVDKAWAVISEAFRKAWEDYIKPALMDLWRSLKLLWKEVLAPFFSWVSPMILWLARKIIPILSQMFAIHIRLISGFIRFILVPQLKVIAKVMVWLWDNVLKPTWKRMSKDWATLVKGMRDAWRKYLKPAWEAVESAANFLWERILKVVFEDIGDAWQGLMSGMKKFWNKVLKPVFDYMGDKALPALQKAFKSTIGHIKDIWNDLKKIVGAPIRFVIETVLNNGLIAGFNKVAKFVGSKGIKDIKVPNWTYASGGVLPGYTPGRDVHHFSSPTGGRLHLSGGEAIMRPEWTHAVGRGYIDKMNLIASRGGAKAVRKAVSGAGDAHFKRGGVVWPVPGRRTSNYPGHDGVDINRGSGSDDYGDPIVSATSGLVSYVGSGRGYGNAVFITSPYGQLVYGHMSSYGPVRAGQRVNAGQFIGRVGSTGNSTAPHLHFGFPGGSPAAALALLNGAAMGNYDVGDGKGVQTPSLPKWIKAVMKSPVGWIKDKIGGGLSKITEKFGDSPMMDMIKGVPKKLVSLVGGKIKSMLGNSDKIEAAVSSSSVAGDMAGSVATGEAQKIVQSMAAARGWDGAQWSALRELVRRESSWNPKAANPSSSARGLFQKMTSIHGAIEPTVQGQATWGLDYIKRTYGSPSRALSFHNSHGWYRDGGVVGEGPSELPYNGTMMYDNGGMLPTGLTSVLNLTGKPERVFTENQWSNIQNGDSTGGNIHYEPHFEGSDLGPEDVASDLNFQFRRLQRGGRYSKVGSQ